MAPRRIAALAVCLLAMAAGASASCSAGSITMELVDAEATLKGSEIAKCLSTATVSIATNCEITISAPNADNSYVNALWSSDPITSQYGIKYTELKLCPAASTPVYNTNVPTSLALAFNGYAYGFDTTTNPGSPTALKGAGVTSVTFTNPGRVVVNFDSTVGKNLVYAIRETADTTTSLHLTDAVVVPTAATGFTTSGGNMQVRTSDVGLACPTDRYGMLVGSIKLCPLCPAGTIGSDGHSCKSCDAGKAYGSVGGPLNSCTQCPAGSYAPQGSSDCVPCPMHTYSAAGAGECTACPEDTYAWLPGSEACMRCTGGVATPHTGSLSAASEGNAILSISTRMQTCDVHTLNNPKTDYSIPVYGQCASWSAAGTPTLKLSLTVADDCSVWIRPIGDKSCSDPGATKGDLALFPFTAGAAGGLDGSNNYVYNYNDLKIRAYYTAPTAIRTLMPSNVTSSFMLNIVPSGTSNQVTLQFYAATTRPAESGLPASTTCTPNAVVDGGSVANVGPAAGCAAGSYSDTSGCKPCPQGSYCASGTKTDCGAATANPYLGQTQASDCAACNQETTSYTSLAAAPYCTVPWWNKMCNTTHGYEWDEYENKCVQCQPGTFRDMTSSNPKCQDCAIGKYSGWGEQSCTDCPAGQYNPTTGMGDQRLVNSTTACLRCPRGSIALKDTQSMNTQSTIQASDYRNEAALSAGASQCDACPSGTWANPAKTEAASGAQGCTLCPSGTYRSGDAAPENNKCRDIPAGYKASAGLVSSGATGATNITMCEKGKISFRTAGVRTPADATTCQACTDGSGTAAPRTGMAQCNLCQGGYYPKADHTACVECSSGTYRSFLNATDSCTTCPAGWEVGNTPRTSCTKCRKGFFKTVAGTNDTCTACPINTYRPTIGASGAVGTATGCIWCPPGKETQDTGNSECTECALGYYNPVTADASMGNNPACMPAPAGTFVNTTGATVATQCPVGTFNSDTAQDACEPCSPGQYANTRGNVACKTCPAGTSSGAQASTCKVCPAGYSAPAGSASCSPCKPGTYAGTARSGTCTLCPKGAQCPTPATVTPKLCPAGSFAARDGAILCTPCPANYFSSTSGSTKCTPCAAGSNTRGLTGQKVCQTVRITPTGLRRAQL